MFDGREEGDPYFGSARWDQNWGHKNGGRTVGSHSVWQDFRAGIWTHFRCHEQAHVVEDVSVFFVVVGGVEGHFSMADLCDSGR